MAPFDFALLVISGLGFLYFLACAYGAVRLWASVPVLSDLAGPELEHWPRLSVIAPARNEARSLEAAVRSRLADDYPDLEVVVVNDRSTDETGAIADRLAAEDPQVKAVHVRELLEGWLGKLHALDVGQRATSGQWLLFSDADVHVAPGTVRAAIAWCEANQVDHLTVFPALWPTQPLVDIAMAVFTRLGLVMGRAWRVPDPSSEAAMGVGAFNLVRRSAFESTRGFEWLRMETADDWALGQMLKRSGAKQVLALGRERVGVHFVRTMGELARSAEKGALVFRFRLSSALAFFLVLTLLELAPWLGLLAAQAPSVRALGATGAALSLFANVAVNARNGNAVGPALLAPLGALLLNAVTLRGGLLAWKHQAIRWRGTTYPAAALLEGRRLEFP